MKWRIEVERSVLQRVSVEFEAANEGQAQARANGLRGYHLPAVSLIGSVDIDMEGEWSPCLWTLEAVADAATKCKGADKDRRHCEPWTCDQCGKRGEWGPGWRWYGSEKAKHSRNVWYDDGTIELVACSQACADVLEALAATSKGKP